MRAVNRVVGLNPSPDSELGACESRNDESIIIERRARNRVTGLPTLCLYRPDRFACPLVQCDKLSIEPTYKYFALADTDASAGPAAAGSRYLRVQLCLVFPQPLSCIDGNCKYVIVAGDDIDDAVVNDRLSLSGVPGTRARTIQPRTPHGL